MILFVITVLERVEYISKKDIYLIVVYGIEIVL